MAMNDLTTILQQAGDFIRSKIPSIPRLAIILGSGLGDFADRLTNATMISTTEIPFYPRSTVAGHAGFWVHGQLSDQTVLAVKGRVHLYEGYSMAEVTLPVRLLARLGVEYLVITNAAGSLNLLIRPGNLMLITDHINLFFSNPLVGQTANTAERFIDMSAPYHPELMKIAEQTALDLGIPLKKGILIGSKGPTYETTAEVELMRRLGGDAAAMSTIPEVIVANQLGLKVLGISCITNLATGLSEHKLDHREVTAVAARVTHEFQKLIEETISRIYRQAE